MSRSNVPANQPGAWPPVAHPQQDYAGPETTGRPAPRAPAQAAPQPHSPYAQPPHAHQQPHAPSYPAFPDPQSPYGDPAAFGRAPYAQPTHPATQPTGGRAAQGGISGQPSYMPQFDPYVPPSQPSPYAQGQSFAPPAQHAPTPAPAFPPPAAFDTQRAATHGGSRPQPAAAPDNSLSQLAAFRAPPGNHTVEPAFQPQPSFPPPQAFAQPQQAPQHHDAWRQPMPSPTAQAPQPTPHGFDLGGFMPQTRADEPTAGRRAGQPADLNFAEWPRSAPAFGQTAAQPQQPELAVEPHFDAGEGYEGYDAQNGEYEQAPEEEDGQFEYDEPKKRSSLFLVAGALVGAVVIGSGLAFVYQKFTGGPVNQTAAVVKSEGGPSKVKPAEPGGKQFANTDSKVMGRLTDGGAPITTSSTGGDDPAAPRKVATIPVGRDGSLSAPAPSADAPAASPQPTVAVPGLTIVDGFGGRSAAPARPVTATVVTPPVPPAATAAPAQPVVVTPPPAATVKPVVTAKAAPPAATTDAVEPDISMAAAEAAPAAPKKAAPVKKKVVDAYGAAGSTVTAAAGTTPAPAAAPAVTSTGGNGFIPVLASVPVSSKSRMDALKQFADMQQKYANVLGDKTPDVQEANLGEKGTYHRLLAGPPGSREQASQVCSQLKTAGYTGCWVTAY